MNIADRRQLFVDHLLIERLDGAQLRLREPVSGGIAIRLDQPWEGPASFGYAVFRHHDRYLLYYRAMTLRPDDVSGVLCVAVSDDGSRWEKPALDLVARHGHRSTNIVADENGEGFIGTPWLDTRPDVPAGERIKVITSEPLSGEAHTAFRDPKGPKRLVFRASGDGFRFHRLDPQPELVSKRPNCFDGGNTMFWSPAEQQYVLYYRWWDSHRSIARTCSPDLMHWRISSAMEYGDSPREHLYRNNTVPYFRAPATYIALAARFMPGRRVLTPAQIAQAGLHVNHGNSYADDCSDGVLMSSRAGSHVYDRTFMEAFVHPGPGPGNWGSRSNYPLTGILPCGDERVMFWVNRRYMQDAWQIERLLLRTDGFAAVHAPYAGGELLTKPLRFAGDGLEINFRTGAAGGLRLELQDAAGQPLPGFAVDACPELVGDEIDRQVVWGAGADLGALAGSPVRLRFVMRDADLYSFRFRER